METEPRSPIRQSGLGIASFVLSLLSTLGICLVFAAAVFVGRQIGNPNYRLYPLFVALALFATVAGCAVGVALGIAGVVQKERRKELAVAGLVLGLITLGGLALIILLVILRRVG